MDAGSPAAPSLVTRACGPVLFLSAETTLWAMENTGAIAEVVLDGIEVGGGSPVDENTEKLGT